MNKKLPKLENPKKIANGKAKVTYPKSRKKMRDLPKLDDVQKKRGKLLGASIAAMRRKMCAPIFLDRVSGSHFFFFTSSLIKYFFCTPIFEKPKDDFQ